MQERTNGVDRPGCIAGQELERDERRAAAGRARVLEAAPEQLQLLAETELADRAIRDGTLLVVLAPRLRFELVRPLRAHLREIAFSASLGQLVGRRGGLCECQEGTGAPPTSETGRLGGPM